MPQALLEILLLIFEAFGALRQIVHLRGRLLLAHAVHHALRFRQAFGGAACFGLRACGALLSGLLRRLLGRAHIVQRLIDAIERLLQLLLVLLILLALLIAALLAALLAGLPGGLARLALLTGRRKTTACLAPAGPGRSSTTAPSACAALRLRGAAFPAASAARRSAACSDSAARPILSAGARDRSAAAALRRLLSGAARRNCRRAGRSHTDSFRDPAPGRTCWRDRGRRSARRLRRRRAPKAT